jgi:hypothetical protein
MQSLVPTCYISKDLGQTPAMKNLLFVHFGRVELGVFLSGSFYIEYIRLWKQEIDRRFSDEL